MARFNPPTGGLLQSLLGGPRRVALPLSLYGKLPVYKDFLRVNVTGAEATALRAWLDRGFSRFWEADDASRDADLPPHAFLLHLPGADGAVLGRLRGSHDSGGLRRFPLALFVVQPAGKGAGRTLPLLHFLGQSLPALLAADQAVAAAGDVETLYDRARELTLCGSIPDTQGVLAKLGDDIAGQTEAGFARALYGPEAERLWPALRQLLTRAAGTGRLAVRLPVTQELPLVSQALLWVSVLVGPEGRRQPPVSVLLPLTEPAAGLVLLQRDLRPDDTLLFNPDCRSFEFVEDLRHEVPGAATAEPLPDRTLSALFPR